ncbi:aspartyl protease family [Plasmopara halstedii]|uniref:Aspartyl protease family n=1 Tax=Plasmopara halstedii TaxID=4781 RepID=A0A0P1B323_PLAHL|nr:aspartyl protease family [Plasmopara halstedii]CEG48338.1 aspartyl protease family [Plasmopara halstedii]|eukprot:XP_024584707.1 aspartyl protease family [Plasmopara halstedii]
MTDSVQNGCYVALISLLLASNFILIPVPVQLITSASAIVYIGSTLSLKLKHAREASGEKNEEVMKAEDAYMFPLLGSGVLLGLYVLFKIFDKDLVNLLLTSYFALIGAYSLTEAFSPLISTVVFKGDPTVYKRSIKIPFYGVYKLELSTAWMLTFVFAAAFAAAWFHTKHYVLNNIFGISLSIKGIEALSLGSFKVGAILLSGLFFYDIFWVFGTDVMVTVATSFDAPIKLIFPREFATETEKQKNSILGLGDIVIPGIFVALLLRYDAHRANASSSMQKFPKPFFYVNLLFYTLGLVATVSVMYIFDAAQPALLYLVPACLGSALVTAFVRGEFKELLEYTEEEEESDSQDDKKEDDAKEEEKKTK